MERNRWWQLLAVSLNLEESPSNPNPDQKSLTLTLCSHSSHYFSMENLFFLFGDDHPSPHVSLNDLEIRKPRELLCRGHDSCKKSKRHPQGFAQVGLLLPTLIPILLQSKKKKSLTTKLGDVFTLRWPIA